MLSSYTQYAPSVAPIYKALAPKLYIAVFSGDVDSCVPYPGTEANVDLLGYPVKVRRMLASMQAARLTPRCTQTKWAQWKVDNQIAGYYKTYDVGTGAPGLSYTTVKDAGHMVATYKPVQALAFFTNFLKRQHA